MRREVRCPAGTTRAGPNRLGKATSNELHRLLAFGKSRLDRKVRAVRGRINSPDIAARTAAVAASTDGGADVGRGYSLPPALIICPAASILTVNSDP